MSTVAILHSFSRYLCAYFLFPLQSHSVAHWNIIYPLLTYSMVQSRSWEANWFAASQEIPRISRNPKVHYRTHKRPLIYPNLNQSEYWTHLCGSGWRREYRRERNWGTENEEVGGISGVLGRVRREMVDEWEAEEEEKHKHRQNKEYEVKLEMRWIRKIKRSWRGMWR